MTPEPGSDADHEIRTLPELVPRVWPGKRWSGAIATGPTASLSTVTSTVALSVAP